MTALSGIWRPIGSRHVASECAHSLAAQKIYGPDRTDQLQLDDVAMGRNLKKLLPEDRFDRQPLSGGNGRFLIVADVRLDNRGALVKQLGIETERQRVLSDAAIILAAYERWGSLSIDRLRGDFAFALWDAKDHKMILARDHVGARPMHFYHGRDLIAFASMPKGLFALADIPKKVDLEFVEQTILHASLEGERSYFENIYRVKPGHYGILDQSGFQQIQYWKPDVTPLKLSSHQEYVDAVTERFDNAVSVRLRGADNVAAHFSAGLDSSAVATSAAILLENTGRVTAYTAVPRDGYVEEDATSSHRIIDEGILAAQAAQLYPNIDHIRVPTTGRSLLEGLDRLTYLQYMPGANLCNNDWIVAINEHARAIGHNVLLTGQLGNMTFSHNGANLLAELLKSGRIIEFAKAFSILKKTGWTDPERAVIAAIMNILPVAVQRYIRRRRGRESHIMAPPELLQQKGSRATHRMASRTEEILTFLGRIELGNFNKAQLGGWGLDYRDPTADRDLMELCLTIPTAQFCHQGVPRSIARDMLRNRLPEAMIAEQRKGLQAADWHESFVKSSGAIIEELEIISEYGPLNGMIDTAKLQQLMESLPDGGWNDGDVTPQYRAAILRSVAVGDFVRRASGANR